MGNRSDNFNRTDSSSSIQSPSDGGANWTIGGGTWGIASNRGYCEQTSASPNPVITLEASSAVVDVQCAIPLPDPAVTGKGLVIRYADMNNYIFMYLSGANYIQLFKMVAGISTEVGSASYQTLAPSDIYKIGVTAGNVVTCYVNGSSAGQPAGTITEGASNTKHGLMLNGYTVNTQRFEDFSITDNGGGGGGATGHGMLFSFSRNRAIA